MGSAFAVILWVFALLNVSLAQYKPKDYILLNCGAPNPHSNDSDGRTWSSDIGSKFLSSTKGSTTATADSQAPDVGEVPFMSARLFQSTFTYNISVSPGKKFVRLYFYPNTYSGQNTRNAIFSVTSGAFTLLSNFSAAQTTKALNYDYLIKEYSFNVKAHSLRLTFTPSSNYSNAFAFVNGIEVVSMPDVYDFIYGVRRAGGGATLPIDKSTALEGLYRLNVGGNHIPPTQDTGLYRTWWDDTPYLFGAATGMAEVAEVNITFSKNFPKYIAPKQVYYTARSMPMIPWENGVKLNSNLTWLFTVDTGFNYLVRLHFCDIFANITEVQQIAFHIYLDNRTAYAVAYDIILEVTLPGKPNVQDFVVMVRPSVDPQRDLWLALKPDAFIKPQYYTAFLNGLEIFKINNTDGNLAGKNPIPAREQGFNTSPSTNNNARSHGAVIGGCVAGVIALVFLFAFVAYFLVYGKFVL